MKKIQIAGFLISALLFILTGLIFIVYGLYHDNRVLKYMGYFWIPAGMIQLLIILLTLHKERIKYRGN